MWFRVHFNDFDNFRNSDKNVCRRLEHVCARSFAWKKLYSKAHNIYFHMSLIFGVRILSLATRSPHSLSSLREKRKWRSSWMNHKFHNFRFFFRISLFTIPSTATSLPRLRALMVNGSPNNDYKSSAST